MKLGLASMWFVTTLTPLVILPTTVIYDGGRWSVEPTYYFLFGAYNPLGGADPSGWITGPIYVMALVTLLLFFIIYAFQVTLYTKETMTTRRWAIISGILSLLIPYAYLGFLFHTDIEILLGAGGVFIGPLPFQFALGLLVMGITGREDLESMDDFLENGNSWGNEK